METVLSVKNLSYSYNENKKALNGISLDIHCGERIAVIGSNGAGKSTFFLNLNGVLTPDGGEIIFEGNPIDKKSLIELRKNVGIVFQNADNQIIASTVLAEVSFGPINMKLPRDEVKSRCEEAMEYMNITHLKDRPPHYLSGGEKKCVSIADIIAMKPKVIIFDEPTEGLDPINAKMLEDALDRLNKEGKTILLSTHDVDFAYRWADRAVVFSDGEIIADDTPINVFRNNDAVKRARLRRPAILEIYETLCKKRLISQVEYPRSVSELKKLIEAV
ncbi:MAG: energy-coupling factor ABC transporter ATP-binding protein [Hominilimicola sp.]